MISEDNGPEKAHLIHGLWLYLNDFKNDPRAGTNNTLSTKSLRDRNLSPICQFVTSFKTVFFMNDSKRFSPNIKSQRDKI